ncbi:MAG: RDD family protein [Jaaginema sp. PMC 1079.18]|nr:RDD family protein [Jaaginema sp. PMC 1080.18]MEC4849420.1 RDD family protein [Jaaginema sp. PMC 1079.18]MEC4864948.1 RDD family protein [Jaaginema sp. PMC 1078.18]
MHLLNRITLKTPESVELEFTLAGIGNRAIALVVDYFIWGISLFLLGMLLFTLLIRSLQFSPIFGFDNESFNLWLVATTLLAIFIIYCGYFIFFETLWRGQTPGKRLLNIRVIRDNGQAARLSQAILRALLRPLDDLLSIGAILIMLTPKEKRLGDWFAGTIVIQEERSITKENFVISEDAKFLASYLNTYINLQPLLPEDFTIIREYLQRRSLMETQARAKKSRELARQIRDIIKLETIPEGVTANQFLEAIYWAYQN